MPTYPYSSGQSAVAQTFLQLRKGFPAKVDAGYLQRFSIAPANESYMISILRFLGLIDEEGDRRDEQTGFFFGGDEVFKPGLEQTVRDAYSNLFDEMGDDSLTAEKDALVNWFRASDKTSALVGNRQASTFQTLAALAGYGDLPNTRPNGSRKTTAASAATKKSTARKSATSKSASEKVPPAEDATGERASAVGLTVRIEVNLPSGGDTDTYDAIFASIKKHLMS